MFIVATEEGIMHELVRRCPSKKIMILKKRERKVYNCAYMKLNNLQKIHACLKDEANEIIMEKEIMERARKPIMKMLSLS